MRWPCTGKGGNREVRGRFLEFRLRRDSADPTRFRLPMAPPSVNIGTIEGSTQTTSCDLCPSKDNCHIQMTLGHQYFTTHMHTMTSCTPYTTWHIVHLTQHDILYTWHNMTSYTLDTGLYLIKHWGHCCQWKIFFFNNFVIESVMWYGSYFTIT